MQLEKIMKIAIYLYKVFRNCEDPSAIFWETFFILSFPESKRVTFLDNKKEYSNNKKLPEIINVNIPAIIYI